MLDDCVVKGDICFFQIIGLVFRSLKKKENELTK